MPYFFGGFGIGAILSTQFYFGLRTISHCLRESKAFLCGGIIAESHAVGQFMARLVY